jgi:dihydrodipicolinate synthase/N-acetylneuraminate lyase
MISSGDLRGMMAMMPAFATDNAGDVRATDTVDVGRLHQGLDRMIRDGADVIATTGSFGECHTLLPDEFRTLAHETISAAKKRVPLFIGVTAPNSREAMQRVKVAVEAGAEGVLAGVPYYFPSSLPNAIRFYRDLAELFPKTAIMLYHNPALHHVTFPVEAFHEFVKIPTVVAMKDSHRTPEQFVQLKQIVKKNIAMFVFQGQYAEYADLGAEGFWSIEAWLGPWPQLALRDAVARGDGAAARAITADIVPARRPAGPPDLTWRETAHKIAVRRSGYVDPGPLRPPFLEVPPEVLENIAKRVERWRQVCAKYQPVNA